MHGAGVLSEGRRDKLLNFPWQHDAILHEAGIPPIHTPIKTLQALPDDVKARLHVVHVAASSIPAGVCVMPCCAHPCSAHTCVHGAAWTDCRAACLCLDDILSIC
jgi:hypothetical protein